MEPLAVLIFISGAVVGSFLNVCIVRLPKEKSVVFPGSHCVFCQGAIAWHDNIPLISWLALGGKCRLCKRRISFRYWLVELLTAGTFLGLYLYYGENPVLWTYLVMFSCFIVAVFVDFAERIIPDEVSVGGMFAGILLSVLVPLLHPLNLEQAQLSGFMAGLLVLLCAALTLVYPFFCKHLMEEGSSSSDRGVHVLVACSLFLLVFINCISPYIQAALTPYLFSLSAALSGYIVGGGMVYAMGLFGDIAFKKESMGGGDVKLMAMVGAFLGWKLAVLAFFLAPFFGAVYGIIEKIRTKDSTIAYGPFLVLGTIVSLFWGDRIIAWIMAGGIYGS